MKVAIIFSLVAIAATFGFPKEWEIWKKVSTLPQCNHTHTHSHNIHTHSHTYTHALTYIHTHSHTYTHTTHTQHTTHTVLSSLGNI